MYSNSLVLYFSMKCQMTASSRTCWTSTTSPLEWWPTSWGRLPTKTSNAHVHQCTQRSLIHADIRRRSYTNIQPHTSSGVVLTVWRSVTISLHHLYYLFFILFYQFKPTHQRLLVNKLTGQERARIKNRGWWRIFTILFMSSEVTVRSVRGADYET